MLFYSKTAGPRARLILSVALSGLAAACAHPTAKPGVGGAAVDLHVSSKAAANADCSPSRPCTFQAAIVRTGPLVADGRSVDVLIGEGTYYLGESGALRITDKAGDGDAETGALVRYRAAPGARPVLSGGAALRGAWRAEGDDALLYCAKGSVLNPHARQMFIGDDLNTQRRAVLARAEVRALAGESHDAGFRLDTARGEIVGPRDGLSAAVIEEVNGRTSPTPLKFRFSFLASMVPVEKIEIEADGLRLVPPADMRSLIRGFYGELFGDGANFNFAGARLEGLASALDAPGEFLIEAEAEGPCGPGASLIRYIPFDDAERRGLLAGTMTVVLPVLETLLTLQGDANDAPNTSPVENVSFEGLSFAHTTFNPVIVRPGEDRFPAHIELERGSYLRPKNDARGEADPESARNLVWVMPPSRLYVSEGVPTSRAYGFLGTRPFALLYAERERLREGWLPASVLVRHSLNVSFVDNVFAHTGAGGLAYDGGARDVVIKANRYFDLGATAIRVGGVTALDRHPYCPIGAWPKSSDRTIRFAEPGGDQPFFPGAGCDIPQTPSSIGRESPFHNLRIQISGNHIESVGKDFEGSVGVNVTYASEASISANTLQDLSYTGITLGHGFGYFDGAALIKSAFGDLSAPPLKYDLRLWRRQHATIARDSRITNNLIIRPLSLLEDGGGIYVNSDQNGTLIEGNYIEMTPLPIPRRGLYLDEGASRLTIRDNVVLGALSGILLSQTDKSEAIIGNVVDNVYADRQGEAPPDGYHAYDPAGHAQAAHRTIPERSDAWLRNETNKLEPVVLIDPQALPPEALRIRDAAGAR